MIKKFLIIVVMVFACGTLHAQEYGLGYDNTLRDELWSNGDNEYKKVPGTGMPGIGMDHGEKGDGTPIGEGIVLLIGLGAAYALKNRKKNE